jgi:hypothetical protein
MVGGRWGAVSNILLVVSAVAGGCVASPPLIPPCPETTAYYLCTWPPETATEATCEDDANEIAVPVVGTCEPKQGVECVKACPDGRRLNP